MRKTIAAIVLSLWLGLSPLTAQGEWVRDDKPKYQHRTEYIVSHLSEHSALEKALGQAWECPGGVEIDSEKTLTCYKHGECTKKIRSVDCGWFDSSEENSESSLPGIMRTNCIPYDECVSWERVIAHEYSLKVVSQGQISEKGLIILMKNNQNYQYTFAKKEDAETACQELEKYLSNLSRK